MLKHNQYKIVQKPICVHKKVKTKINKQENIQIHVCSSKGKFFIVCIEQLKISTVEEILERAVGKLKTLLLLAANCGI